MRPTARARALGVAVALAGAGPLAGQVAPNRATAYLLPTDVSGSRALWVDPAGLAGLDASVLLDVTVDHPGSRGHLGQLTAGFDSHGLSFAYQRDNFGGGLTGHTYRFGLGAASRGLALGIATAVYKGNTSAVGWDVGLDYSWGTTVTIGGVIANIGHPVVRGLKQETTFEPAATVHTMRARLTFTARGAFISSRALGYAFAARAHLGNPARPIGLIARIDTDQGFRRGAFAFGFSFGGQDQVGLVATTPGDLSSVNAVSLYGQSSRLPPHR